MYDGAVGSTRADCVKTGAFIQGLGCSELVNFLGGLVFSDGGKSGSPGPELGHGYAINNMASSETWDLFLGADGAVEAQPLPLDRVEIFYLWVDEVVDAIFGYQWIFVKFWWVRLKQYILRTEMGCYINQSKGRIGCREVQSASF